MHYIRYGNSVFAKFIQYLWATCFTGCRIKRTHGLCYLLQSFKNFYNFDTQGPTLGQPFDLGKLT